jgi:hypothetical protein
MKFSRAVSQILNCDFFVFYLKKFHHENTKSIKHEYYLFSFSCFRSFRAFVAIFSFFGFPIYRDLRSAPIDVSGLGLLKSIFELAPDGFGPVFLSHLMSPGSHLPAPQGPFAEKQTWAPGPKPSPLLKRRQNSVKR